MGASGATLRSRAEAVNGLVGRCVKGLMIASMPAIGARALSLAYEWLTLRLTIRSSWVFDGETLACCGSVNELSSKASSIVDEVRDEELVGGRIAVDLIPREA